ncbi:putative HNHc nuclease [Liquorilactobacillus cacaonum]|uniref:Phage protein n=1 Tax=Liquorilactobacillus cacaonum DSM 21116 TaxID=1423729 RepID=A0A0R2CJT6_9LACO|nr:putative HNHc nuclease [Liquorilactobacillus cacaonum]KRM91472.1 hypothetical protein FC80_GL000438 [Liquorilactobacillus cacaonum DSM 21116]
MENERYEGHVVSIKKDLVTFRIDEIDSMIKLLKKGRVHFDLTEHEPEQITGIQRRKAYAMIHDIGMAQGCEQSYEFQKLKVDLKDSFCRKSGYGSFSLSNCSKYVATDFISWLVELCFFKGIPFQFKDLVNTFDTERQVFLCLVHKRCTVCGQTNNIQINHEDTVGMGNDRKHLNHRNHRLEALCSYHHLEFHRLGSKSFFDKYHFHGTKLRDEQLIALKLMSQKQMQEFDEEYEREKLARRNIDE